MCYICYYFLATLTSMSWFNTMGSNWARIYMDTYIILRKTCQLFNMGHDWDLFILIYYLHVTCTWFIYGFMLIFLIIIHVTWLTLTLYIHIHHISNIMIVHMSFTFVWYWIFSPKFQAQVMTMRKEDLPW